jgi:hypothetical protein
MYLHTTCTISPEHLPLGVLEASMCMRMQQTTWVQPDAMPRTVRWT